MDWSSRLRKNSMLLVILGGAALQRCDNCIVWNAALQAAEKLNLGLDFGWRSALALDWFRRNWRALSFVAGLIGVWAIVAALRLVDPIILPAPWNVARVVPG